MVIQKDVFWKAAILTIVVLAIGIWIGITLDTSRVDEIKNTLSEVEIQFNDARMQALYHEKFFTNDSEFCNAAIDSNLKFNDVIYQEGIQIERAELVNRFTPDLIFQKRKYALLQMQFWMNSLSIKEKCNSNFTTILYLYNFNVQDDRDTDINQKLQSAFLLDLKEKCGSSVMLSPLPANINLTSVDLLVNNYNIKQLPSIIIDKNITLQGLHNLTELERYVTC